MIVKFGRLAPKDRAHERKYAFAGLGVQPVAEIEKTMRLPSYGAWYDQGKSNACTGYSASWMMSIYNQYRYNAQWMYYQARLYDKDPSTDPPADIGSYVWAAFSALRSQGHVRVNADKKQDAPDSRDGIQSFYWCRTVDQVREAFNLERCVVLGVNWYKDFMTPITKGRERWIGTMKFLGELLGGHAICAYAISDRRQAVRLVNSWGSAYPPVWMPYRTLQRLLDEAGECCVAIDKPEQT